MPSVDDAASDTEQTANARRRARELLAKLAAAVGEDQPASASPRWRVRKPSSTSWSA